MGGPVTGVLAVALLMLQPPVLAHSGVATTDLAITATLPFAALALCAWLDSPTGERTLLLGATWGLALLAKFSAVVFLPVATVAILAFRLRQRRRVMPDFRLAERDAGVRPRFWGYAARMVLATYVAFMVVWAGYRFSFGPPGAAVLDLAETFLGTGSKPGKAVAVLSYLAETSIPAPEFVRGVASVARQQDGGYAKFFLGERNPGEGTWSFFPVVLAIKTPVPFLLLSFVGVVGAWRSRGGEWGDRRLAAVGLPLLMLLAVLPSDINLGVRHVLPLYPLLAVVAAMGGLRLWNAAKWSGVARTCVGIAIAGIVWSSIRAHPDYLAYFNVLAGAHPEDIVVDSDLDWGQDLDRLAKELRRREVPHVWLAYFGTAIPERHGLPSHEHLPPYQSAAGWIAVSLFELKTNSGYEWLEQHSPVATIGRSIRLYYVDGIMLMESLHQTESFPRKDNRRAVG